MERAFWFGACPFVFFALLHWQGLGWDFFTASGAALWISLPLLTLSFVLPKRKDPFFLHNPLPQQYSLDSHTAMHAVKSALIGRYLGASQWRLVQMDTELGVFVACLDAFEFPAGPGQVPERIAVHSQLLLIAEFNTAGKQTEVKLRWVPRKRMNHHLELLVERLSETIDSMLTSEQLLAASSCAQS